MAPAPLVGEAFFPLDEQLGLSSGGLTPRAEETLVRLATWMPYAQAQELERATAVCAVQDGAEWLQKLVDYHRTDAVRILDFAHAAEYINAIGQAVQAAGGKLPARWFEGVLHRLKHQGPQRVLAHLAW